MADAFQSRILQRHLLLGRGFDLLISDSVSWQLVNMVRLSRRLFNRVWPSFGRHDDVYPNQTVKIRRILAAWLKSFFGLIIIKKPSAELQGTD